MVFQALSNFMYYQSFNPGPYPEHDLGDLLVVGPEPHSGG